MQVYNDEHLTHFGIKGMHWGHHKRQIESLASRVGTKIERTAYSIGAQINPREFKYKIRKLTNNVNSDVKLLADLTLNHVKQNGILPNNHNALKVIESVGINAHKNSVYNNLDHQDLKNLKTYTDSSRYSRSVNGYLAIGDPKAYAGEAQKYRDWETDRKSTRLNSSHSAKSRMPSSA